MIGKAYWATFKYYDGSLHKMAFKKRPILIIGQADEKDYVVFTCHDFANLLTLSIY